LRVGGDRQRDEGGAGGEHRNSNTH
jgi:hypothetical protein